MQYSGRLSTVKAKRKRNKRIYYLLLTEDRLLGVGI